MATKTFEELKQLAIQIRDEKTNKQNTATRVGTAMLEHINKLEQDYYDKTTINNRTSEYNVSINHPTSGISSSNKYDLSSAIAQVPAELRSDGLTVSFINSAGDTEKWEFGGGSWSVSSFSQVGAEKLTKLDSKTLLVKETAVNAGDIMYNKSTKLLRKLKEDGSWETIPFISGAIYQYKDGLYKWNGEDLVDADARIGTVNTVLADSLYVVCNTGGATIEKTVIVNNFVLSDRCRMLIKFVNTHKSSTPATLNINNTGAKNILYYNKDVIDTYGWKQNEIVEVIYDGNNYIAKTYTQSYDKGYNGFCNAILTWNTDFATTRKAVNRNERLQGMIISYQHPTFGWRTEQYIGTNDFGDGNFPNDINWSLLHQQVEEEEDKPVPVTDMLIHIYNFNSEAQENFGTYYNTNTKQLRRYTQDGWETVQFIPGAIYQYKDGLYKWNGEDLVNANEDILQIISTKLNYDDVFRYNYVNAALYVPSGGSVMLTGASIGSSNNGWFELACKSKNVNSINKAVGATNIGYLANALYNYGKNNSLEDLPNLFNKEEFENHDALIIMYVHDRDAYTLLPVQGDREYNADELKAFKASDYETAKIIPINKELYEGGAWLDNNLKAAMYDYCIKKYYELCYNMKNDTESKWYNIDGGKPVQIALCTFWDDTRQIISTAQRKLCEKWGFPLIALDVNVGFTGKINNPETGKPTKNFYTTDGTHPLSGEEQYIQRKLAAIASQSIIVI